MLVDEYGVAERGEADEPVDNAPQTSEASAQSVAPEESAPSATLDEQIDAASDDEIASGVSNAPVSKTEEAVADVGNDAQDEEETEPPRSPVVSEDKKKGIVTYKSDAFGANIKERKVKRDEREYLVPVVKLKSFNLDRESEFVRYVERLEDNAPASEVVDKCLEILGGVSRAGANTPEEWRYRYAELEELRRVLTKTLKDPMHQGEDMMEALSRIDSLDGRFWTDDFSNLFERVESEEDLIGIINSRIGYEPRRAKDSGVSGDGIGPNATAFDKAYKWDYESWWKEEQEDRKRQKQAEKSPAPAEPAPEPSEAATREIAAEVNPPEPDADAATGDEAAAQSVAEGPSALRDAKESVRVARDYAKETEDRIGKFFESKSKDSQFDADKIELKRALDSMAQAQDKFDDATYRSRRARDEEEEAKFWAEREAADRKRSEARDKAQEILDRYPISGSEIDESSARQRDVMFLIGRAYIHGQRGTRSNPSSFYLLGDFLQSAPDYPVDSFGYAALFNRALQHGMHFDYPSQCVTLSDSFKKLPSKGFADSLKDEQWRSFFTDARFNAMLERVMPRGRRWGEDFTRERENKVFDAIVKSKKLTQLAYNYFSARENVGNESASHTISLTNKYSPYFKTSVKAIAPFKSKETRALNALGQALREAMPNNDETPQQTEDEDGA